MHLAQKPPHKFSTPSLIKNTSIPLTLLTTTQSSKKQNNKNEYMKKFFERRLKIQNAVRDRIFREGRIPQQKGSQKQKSRQRNKITIKNGYKNNGLRMIDLEEKVKYSDCRKIHSQITYEDNESDIQDMPDGHDLRKKGSNLKCNKKIGLQIQNLEEKCWSKHKTDENKKYSEVLFMKYFKEYNQNNKKRASCKNNKGIIEFSQEMEIWKHDDNQEDQNRSRGKKYQKVQDRDEGTTKNTKITKMRQYRLQRNNNQESDYWNEESHLHKSKFSQFYKKHIPANQNLNPKIELRKKRAQNLTEHSTQLFTNKALQHFEHIQPHHWQRYNCYNQGSTKQQQEERNSENKKIVTSKQGPNQGFQETDKKSSKRCVRNSHQLRAKLLVLIQKQKQQKQRIKKNTISRQQQTEIFEFPEINLKKQSYLKLQSQYCFQQERSSRIGSNEKQAKENENSDNIVEWNKMSELLQQKATKINSKISTILCEQEKRELFRNTEAREGSQLREIMEIMEISQIRKKDNQSKEAQEEQEQEEKKVEVVGQVVQIVKYQQSQKQQEQYSQIICAICQANIPHLLWKHAIFYNPSQVNYYNFFTLFQAQRESDCQALNPEDPCSPQCYPQQQTPLLLHCGHSYHKNCLECWLRYKNMCPLCKTKINEEEEQQSDDDEEDGGNIYWEYDADREDVLDDDDDEDAEYYEEYGENQNSDYSLNEQENGNYQDLDANLAVIINNGRRGLQNQWVISQQNSLRPRNRRRNRGRRNSNPNFHFEQQLSLYQAQQTYNLNSTFGNIIFPYFHHRNEANISQAQGRGHPPHHSQVQQERQHSNQQQSPRNISESEDYEYFRERQRLEVSRSKLRTRESVLDFLQRAAQQQQIREHQQQREQLQRREQRREQQSQRREQPHRRQIQEWGFSDTNQQKFCPHQRFQQQLEEPIDYRMFGLQKQQIGFEQQPATIYQNFNTCYYCLNQSGRERDTLSSPTREQRNHDERRQWQLNRNSNSPRNISNQENTRKQHHRHTQNSNSQSPTREQRIIAYRNYWQMKSQENPVRQHPTNRNTTTNRPQQITNNVQDVEVAQNRNSRIGAGGIRSLQPQRNKNAFLILERELQEAIESEDTNIYQQDEYQENSGEDCEWDWHQEHRIWKCEPSLSSEKSNTPKIKKVTVLDSKKSELLESEESETDNWLRNIKNDRRKIYMEEEEDQYN